MKPLRSFLILILCALLCSCGASKSDSISISVLDTGTSDCCLLTSNDGTVTMIDTSFDSRYAEIESYLTENKITYIENLIITCPGSAHIGCAAKIAANYNVKFIYTTLEVANSYAFKAVKEASSAEIIIPEHDSSAVCGDMTVNFLSSESSLVAQFVYNEHSFLFTGDMSPEAETSLLEEYGKALESEFLKVPRHGENNACSQEFLKAVSPVLSVITCSSETDRRLPGADLVSRIKYAGSRALRTDELGTITIYSSGSGSLKYQY